MNNKKSASEEKITDSNKSHLSRYNEERGTRDANRVYRQSFAGDLATLGRYDSRTAGYPFGSVTPFMIDHTGCPVIYTADLAEHTKNILDNGKASLMVRQVERQHQINTGWRLTLAGDLQKVDYDDAERVTESYYRFYPEAKSYAGVHNFSFFRLNIKAIRVIMGFGKISWVAPDDLVAASPFSRDEELRMLEHMNDDHQSAIKHYLKTLDVAVNDKITAPQLVGINQFGAVIDYNNHLYFVEFDELATDAMKARQQLVALTKTP